MDVLVIGGAGYIASAVCSDLEDAGHRPIAPDSLIHGLRAFTAGRVFYESDIANQALLRQSFHERPNIAATLHFAALIVLPGFAEPLAPYYRESVSKNLNFFETLPELGQQRIVFSLGASVYATTPNFRVQEDSPPRPLSSCARSKWMMELMLEDLCLAHAAELAQDELLPLAEHQNLLRYVQLSKAPIWSKLAFDEEPTGQVSLERVDRNWLDANVFQLRYAVFKRILDVLVTLLTLRALRRSGGQ